MKFRLLAATLLKVAIATGLSIAAFASEIPQSPLAAATPETRAQLKRLVSARATAWFNGNSSVYAKYTTSNFLWNGSPAPRPMRVDFPDIRPFNITSFQVFEYSNVAIVSYVLTAHLNYEDGPAFDWRRRTETWVRDGDGWKAAAAESKELCASNTGRSLCY